MKFKYVVRVNMRVSTSLYSHVAYLRPFYCSITLACNPYLMRGTGTNRAYNVTSGSGAPQTQAQTVSDAAQ